MDNLALIIAIVGVGLAMVGTVISMMFWVRSESNSLRTESKEDRRDILNMVRAIELEVRDFHNRFLDIERKRSGK